MAEKIKYGMPCFSYANKPVCYLWTDKKTGEPYILFVEGRWLHHPMLEAGKRTRMKILRIESNRDLPVTTIKLLLRKALELSR